MAAAVEQCRIRTIVTSKAFLAKAKIERMDGMVFVEDGNQYFNRPGPRLVESLEILAEDIAKW